MIEIKDKSQCCGCYACISACPKGCISMQSDSEGFAYPVVASMSCIECGSCQFTCPSHRPILDYVRLGKAKVGAMIRARKKG